MIQRYKKIHNILFEYLQGHDEVCQLIIKYVQLNENYIFVTDQIKYLSNEYKYLLGVPNKWPFKTGVGYRKKTSFYKYILHKNKQKYDPDNYYDTPYPDNYDIPYL